MILKFNMARFAAAPGKLGLYGCKEKKTLERPAMPIIYNISHSG